MSSDRPRSLDWITRLARLDTTSRNSNLELVHLVADAVREHGLEPQLYPSEDGRKANLLVTVPAADGTRSGGVMLSGHTDVVPVDGQDWSSEPFDPQVRDGRLYGRGTCDMKGFLGVALSAVPDMVRARLAEPIHLALSYDEEVGCLGGAAIVKQIADAGLTPRACVVGEPSGMRVVRGHKSVNLVTVRFHGVAAHSSLTSQGVNAIEHAAPFVSFVRAIADDWRDDGPFDPAYPLAPSTASVNLVSGGIAGNTVPALCEVQLEYRTIAEVDPGEVLERLRDKAREIEASMQAASPAASVEVRVDAAVPGLETPTDSPALLLARELGAEGSEGKVTYGTEAGQFAGTGIATVVCGPGDIAQAHAPDEFVELDQIRACEEFVAALIARLSLPAQDRS